MIVAQYGREPSSQQIKLTQLLIDGKTLGSASRKMFISRNTGKTHLAHLSERLGRQGQVAVVVEMLKRGLVSLDSDVTGDTLPKHAPAVSYDLYTISGKFLGHIEVAVDINVKDVALAQLWVDGQHIPAGDLTVGHGLP